MSAIITVHKQRRSQSTMPQSITADFRILQPHCNCGENESNHNQMFSGHLSSSYLYMHSIIHESTSSRVQSTMGHLTYLLHYLNKHGRQFGLKCAGDRDAFRSAFSEVLGTMRMHSFISL